MNGFLITFPAESDISILRCKFSCFENIYMYIYIHTYIHIYLFVYLFFLMLQTIKKYNFLKLGNILIFNCYAVYLNSRFVVADGKH